LTSFSSTDDTSDADVAATIAVRAAAFDAPDRSQEPGAIAGARRGARLSPIALLRSEGRVVGAATLSSMHDGVAEIAGIGVIADARGRGFATALTRFLAGAAFARGAERLVLTAADPAAARVYARAGFRPSPHGVLEFLKNGTA
jgi:predicted GNAT family acetyltransferase